MNIPLFCFWLALVGPVAAWVVLSVMRHLDKYYYNQEVDGCYKPGDRRK